MSKIDNAFIAHASDILADTDAGLSGMKIVELCNAYSIDFNKRIPYCSYPFAAEGKLKMTMPDKPKSSNQKFVKA